ncbi:MAG: N-acetylmuramoyl-L-alanine amidase [Trueperaceae bacterium]
MKCSLPALLFALLCLLLGTVSAQERHNSLAVDENLSEESGPYYFIAYGDSSNAYAKAVPLAQAMGLRLEYSNETKTLTFSGNGTTARMQATSDVAEGLEKRSGVLSANGGDIASPMAIIVGGVSYVPIVPIAKAFECDYAWHSQYRLITVNLPAEPPALPQTSVSPTQLASAQPGTTQASAGDATISGFRIGVHDEFTRVAVDLGSVSEYSIAVRDNMMLITFAANSTAGEPWEQRDENLRAVYFTRVSGRPALLVRTRHDLGADGSGFRTGRTESNTLYFDFAPLLTGSAVAQLVTDIPAEPLALGPDQAPEPVAVAPTPPQARPVVVLDAGHGGKFAGAHNGHWKEEEIVLRVALAAKALLEARGVEVILTRSGDNHLSADYRGDLSARADFATPERNLFVSIHANSFSSSGAEGIETFVFGEPLDPRLVERAITENGGGNRSLGQALTDESFRVASETSGQILRETQLNYSRRLAHSVQRKLVQASGATDRGVKQNVFFVLRNARTPAILVELGFVSNPEEGRKLASEAYQAMLAQALVDGILEFLDTGGTLAVR